MWWWVITTKWDRNSFHNGMEYVGNTKNWKIKMVLCAHFHLSSTFCSCCEKITHQYQRLPCGSHLWTQVPVMFRVFKETWHRNTCLFASLWFWSLNDTRLNLVFFVHTALLQSTHHHRALVLMIGSTRLVKKGHAGLRQKTPKLVWATFKLV